MAEIRYTYRVDGEPFAGAYIKPFIFYVPGERYIKQFVTGAEFTVRVKPGDPLVSVVHKDYLL